jgi:hypothetical protein
MPLVRVPIASKFKLALNVLDRRELFVRKLHMDGVNVFDRSFGVTRTRDGNDLSSGTVISISK